MKREMQEQRVKRPELPAEVFAAIHRVLDSLWAAEERSFWNTRPQGREGHLFGSLSLVRQWLALPARRSRRERERGKGGS